MIAAAGSLSKSDPVTADSIYKLWEQEDYQTAREKCEEELKRISDEEGEDSPQYAWRLAQLGYSLLWLEDTTGSIEFFDQSINILKKHPENKIELVYVYGFRGDWYFEAKEYDSAEVDYLKAYEILPDSFRSVNEHFETAIFNLAFLYSKQRDFLNAKKYYDILIDIRSSLYGKSSLAVASSKYGFGNVYYNNGNYYKAELYYLDALKIIEEFDDADKDLMTRIRTSLLNMYTDHNNFTEAKKHLLFVEKYADEIKETNVKRYAMFQGHIATYYYDIGDLDRAERIYLEVLQNKLSIKDIDPDEIRYTHVDLAKFYKKKGDYKKAKEYIDKVLEYYDHAEYIDRKTFAVDLNLSGIIYETNQEFHRSLEFYEKSLELKKQLFEEYQIELANSYFNCAGVNIYINQDKADKYFKKSNEIYEYNISEIMQYMTESEQENYWFDIRENLEIFQSYVVKYNRQGLISDFSSISLNNKGRILGSQQSLRENSINDEEIKSKYKKLRALKEFMAYTFKSSKAIKEKLAVIDLDSLKEEMRNLEKEILEHVKDKKGSNYLIWTDIQKELTPKEAVVDIIRIKEYDYVIDSVSGNKIPGFTDKVYYAAVIYRSDIEKPIYVLIDSLNQIDSKVINEYNSSIKNVDLFINQLQSIKEVKESLSKIYDVAWSKIDKHLNGIKTVYVSLDGIYHNINLNTLVNSRTNKYLLDQYDIHLVSSLTDFHKQSDSDFKNERNKSAVLMGNADFDLTDKGYSPTKDSEYLDSFIKRGLNKTLTRSGIEKLPGTEKEINNIAKLLKKSAYSVEKFLDSGASEENLKRISGPGILHIATHGYFVQKKQVKKDVFGFKETDMKNKPLLRSMLLLSGAENTIYNPDEIFGLEDGVFTAYEARNLNLNNTELVVLSSCLSGRGDIKNGEGVYGLQRSFILAGAKHLLMSLWKVDDKITSELMKEFYRNYIDSNNIEEAFKRAQITIRKSNPHFNHWGSFVLISN